MHVNRHRCRSLVKLPALLFFVAIGLVQCKVYTINKTTLENKLNPKTGFTDFKTLNAHSVNTLYKKQFRNNLDTVTCLHESGEIKTKRFNLDSKITIITKNNKAIKYYVKTLYIYKDQFLIGERTMPKLFGPNYFPIRLSEISRIEVNGY
jgi:hypothetical protein